MEKIIDLQETYKESEFYLKDEEIIKTIKDNISDYDVIITSINILNIIEQSRYYIKEDTFEVENFYQVGTFLSKKVLIDLSLLDTIVILSHLKDTLRDMKINSLLKNTEIKEDLILRFIF